MCITMQKGMTFNLHRYNIFREYASLLVRYTQDVEFLMRKLCVKVEYQSSEEPEIPAQQSHELEVCTEITNDEPDSDVSAQQGSVEITLENEINRESGILVQQGTLFHALIKKMPGNR